MLLPVLTLSGCSGIPISHSQWLIATDWRTPSRTGSTAQPGSAVTGCPEASSALALTSTSPCGLRDTQHHDRAYLVHRRIRPGHRDARVLRRTSASCSCGLLRDMVG